MTGDLRSNFETRFVVPALRVDGERKDRERLGQLEGATTERGGPVDALAVLEGKMARCLYGVGVGGLLERPADQMVDDVQ